MFSYSAQQMVSWIGPREATALCNRPKHLILSLKIWNNIVIFLISTVVLLELSPFGYINLKIKYSVHNTIHTIRSKFMLVFVVYVALRVSWIQLREHPATCEVRARAEWRAYKDFSQNENSCMPYSLAYTTLTTVFQRVADLIVWIKNQSRSQGLVL